MSFLNPVNEPVKRFSSTDAGAPQINYNARTAGDVKAVLKACLVTGYGAKASAGWTAANETATVIEFVSPSVAMSDYRLGIDDTSAASTTWYYQYQDVRVNPNYNAPVKSISQINKTSGKNGWQLFVTDKGLIFVEIFDATNVTTPNNTAARITYLSAIKSSKTSDVGVNIAFFNIGHGGLIYNPSFMLQANYVHINVAGYGVTGQLFSCLPFNNQAPDTSYNNIAITLASYFYVTSSAYNIVLGQLAGIVCQIKNAKTDLHQIKDVTLDGRPMLELTAGYGYSGADAINYARVYSIPLDYWEY